MWITNHFAKHNLEIDKIRKKKQIFTHTRMDFHVILQKKQKISTLNTAYEAPEIVANTTPPNVGLPVIPSIYANKAIPVSH